MSGSAARLRPGWVVLTTGTRPQELQAALASIGDQVEGHVVVVAQGVDVDVPPDVTVVRLEQNVGIPAGRDAGMRAVDADVVFFLDDDARYGGSDAASRALGRFEKSADLAAVSLRVVDERGETMRRHVPRLGARSADRAGPVTSFLGGACAIRRTAYLEVDGYEGSFFYGHEEMDLAWRLLDAGHAIDYVTEVVVVHPHVPVDHGGTERWHLLGRNRVWLARRRLPHPLDWVHAGVWLAAGLWRSRGAWRAYLQGWRAGWKGEVERRPLRWRTVLRMARLGRPPIV